MLTVQVPERGHTDLDPLTWKRLAIEPYFWHLIDKKILSISQLGQSRMRLEGSCYVGRALFSDISLELEEKVSGALAVLLGSANKDAFRILRISSIGSETGPLIALLVRQFLDGLRAYVSNGREFIYAVKREVGSLVGGRIDTTRSLQLRARGLKHLLVFDRSVLLRNTAKNRVLLAAIREVEALSHVLALERALISDARALALLFDDCRDAEILFGERKQFIKYAEDLLDRQETERDADLLTLAAVILSHASFERTELTSGTVPRAWFLNLENLFEKRVRTSFRDLVASNVRVIKGKAIRPERFLYQDQNLFQADPDLLFQRESSMLVAGDVKYKPWSGSATQDDIYQLLAHAETFGAKKAFLIFPHDEFRPVDLGTSAGGTHTWLFAVDVRNLSEHLAACLKTMDLA